MAKEHIEQVFATKLYRGAIRAGGLNAALEKTCLAFAREDKAGQAWSRHHGYKGYTSYASLDDLTFRASLFAELAAHLDTHAMKFARALDFEMAGKRLSLDSLWINVMEHGAWHGPHIHPHCAISGTYYVKVPPRAADIRFEDPRLAQMMAAPMLKERARRANQRFISLAPKAGTVLLWESWLRHDVPENTARDKRISISFNYALGEKR